MLKTIKFCLLLLILILSGCNSVEKIDNETLSRLKADSSVIVIDVRSSEEYQTEHIPGAKNINVYDSDFLAKIHTLYADSTAPVVLYCNTGNRSSEAYKKLSTSKKEIYSLQHGITGWIAEGYPIKK